MKWGEMGLFHELSYILDHVSAPLQLKVNHRLFLIE